jgi:hypothetical protein
MVVAFFWLSNDAPQANTLDATTPAATPAPAPAPAAAAPTAEASLGPNGMTADEAFAVVREEELKRIVLITRLLNMGVSIAVITMSILTAIGGFKDPKIIILALYSTCGGCLICCLETQLKFFRTAIAMNFGFLFNAGFRFMFYILIASVCYAFQSLFGYIMFGFMLATAFYNTYVLMKYPAYKQLRDKLAAEEDERIQMNLRAEGAKMAAKQMFSK